MTKPIIIVARIAGCYILGITGTVEAGHDSLNCCTATAYISSKHYFKNTHLLNNIIPYQLLLYSKARYIMYGRIDCTSRKKNTYIFTSSSF